MKSSNLPCSSKHVTCVVVSVCAIVYIFQYYDLQTIFTANERITSTNSSDHIHFIARHFNYQNETLNIKGSFEGDTPQSDVILRIANLPSNFLKQLYSKDLKHLRPQETSSKATTPSSTFEDKWLLPPRKTAIGIDCPLLFSGDQSEQKRAKTLMEHPKPPFPLSSYVEMTKDCEKFKRQMHYITSSLTEEEENFPIAYSMIVFKELEQTERLLRAIYRPQNFYCIHIDSKSPNDFRDTLTGIAGCFDNVFITNISVDVRWGTFTVVEPELICMKELWKYKSWKYLINLTGQEFPLRSNAELVKILKVYNGANDLEGTVKRANTGRWAKAGSPPAGIRPVKGSVHITVNRDFVDYVLHNQTAIDFLNWTRGVDIPDECFFASLNHNPHLGIRGTYKGEPETSTDVKPFLTRFKNWGGEPFDWPCHGKRVRMICIFGVEDLPLLAQRPELFVNKLYWDFEPFALDCMEELIYNRTRDGYLQTTKFDTTFYENLDFVKNQV
ncbi:beta-1,3-galactosyl-O-glycosyl-glycoprotein beta-1,6-N-acetylglucosaminyltransferase-like [Pecten maximus]|uniref:beta-1,3-galactosyl-O-glycosyl-glycoprotein beta-1,6-N-acetylglucosaminyltransferase-like n=1 Tax=Pecten maximus TaxID=6579 RepID=UPI001458DBD0|nr:beta-1,3-galactosyl-O-glycosyl-glycoprotein beta-1,6-N-acetylglucosaminyltransferase-like [Pecten maximus]XP_033758607.1 beta-1,3-galactosyl-O-glycosyl-glycoprotein beta-1,6-N-acetylglucosaminyltransferase-like [Pecten maximus]XP_033758608.1 beta-1,3-galactosyl-O-glycosyl-glycoprotein beta-1,6-N-acetylglucosaminyltransferase-like [Pecten maximus]XP_033758609.1 beta-1,3-galactosyl-O-glycosyl-glycoprotein beta-1,6-N-acetylglucosaminyltransferase-like [Pecten maximus]